MQPFVGANLCVTRGETRAPQGYLAHQKQRLARTLHKEYAQGPVLVLGVGAVFKS